jgi:hypothetical protein
MTSTNDIKVKAYCVNSIKVKHAFRELHCMKDEDKTKEKLTDELVELGT